MRQQMRTGIGFYLLILVIIAAAVYVSGTLDSGGQGRFYTEFLCIRCNRG